MDDWTVETEYSEDDFFEIDGGEGSIDEGGECIEEVGFRLLMACYMEYINMCEEVKCGEEEEEDRILLTLEIVWEKINFE
jgi:hypothetical protein